MSKNLPSPGKAGEVLPAVLDIDDPGISEYNPLQYLDHQQKVFVKEYLVDFNGAAAARRAGYPARTAGGRASGLLNNYNVSLAIQREIEARGMRVELSQDMVLRELGWIALSNVANYAMDDEGFVSVADDEVIPSEVMRAVKAVKRRVKFIPNPDGEGEPIKVVETELVLHDKIAALKLLGQHLGMFVEKHKHEHSGPDGSPIQHWVVGGQVIRFV